MKRHDASIQTLAQNYNKLVDIIIQHIDEHRAPCNAVSPIHIEMEHLFSLDVNDDIWQDVGLTETDPSGDPPLWLCDENV